MIMEKAFHLEREDTGKWKRFPKLFQALLKTVLRHDYK